VNSLDFSLLRRVAQLLLALNYLKITYLILISMGGTQVILVRADAGKTMDSLPIEAKLSGY
jgi:hypothetical protein